MEQYDWPGNVRELENIVERAVTLASSDEEMVQPAHLPEDLFLRSSFIPVGAENQTLKDILRGVKRRAIDDALRKHKNNKTKAAEELGISRQGLLKMLKEIGI